MMEPAPAGPAAQPDGDSLEGFFRQVLAANPFLDNRVNAPSAHEVDVEAIHRSAFDQLVRLARAAHEARRGIGAVLWGEAGVGKSHLLSRLARWALAPGRACFVYLHNLQAAPDHLPRSLLHAVVSILTAGRRQRFVGTPLFHLVRAGVLAANGRQGGVQLWSHLERAFAAWVDGLGRQEVPGAALVDRSVYEVLFRFFRSACRAYQGYEDGAQAEWAVRWLAGQALDPAEARGLGLPPSRQRDEPVALADNQQVKQVLVALTRLAAGQGLPFLLAFDQVDNLDAEQASALTRFLEALIDSSPNLLVVTAGIQASLLQWREGRVFQDSAWDRLAQFEVRLHRLTPAEALAIVRARLESFLAPYRDLGPIRQKREEYSLFPLGQPWYDRALRARVDVRPRDVINWAREAWRVQQERLLQEGGPDWLAHWPGPDVQGPDTRKLTPEEIDAAIDRKVEEKMAAHRDWRRREPGGLPPDADHLAGLLFALLVQCREAGHPDLLGVERLPAPRRNSRPTYDLALLQRRPDSGDVLRTGVLVVTAPNAVSVTGFLRRVVEDPRPLDHLVLVTDKRVGLPLGERGKEYFQKLQGSRAFRFQTLELTLDEYIDLDALQAVVGLARSGDLEVEPMPGTARPITPEEVIASHQRRGRYLASRLLRELLTGSAAERVGRPELLTP